MQVTDYCHDLGLHLHTLIRTCYHGTESKYGFAFLVVPHQD